MGVLVGIYIADTAAGPIRSVDRAQLVSGRGIVGDRYYAGTGKFSPAVQDPVHEVTLVEIEQLAHFNSTYGMALRPDDLRRNLLTSHINLNDLVGAEFLVGDVLLKGIKLCEPCEYLAGLTHRNVLPGLLHRGGLRAGILQGGIVKLEDAVALREAG